ncbi:MAG: 4'-phosphopantetheinyl transferase superfamily protein [Candidatus Azobacteroides sp.]|nr:4'-phosphopantetheinyl transferase superfamily protein [Candidatus Azobacteroides sp.]
MPLFKIHHTEDYSWAIWELNEPINVLESGLNGNYSPFLEKYSLESQKKEFLAARILTRRLIGEEKEIHYHSTGKPYIQDMSHYISISHSKNYIAVIISSHKPVGIDIEYISERVLTIKKRFLSEEELNWIDRKKELIYPIISWSAKESMFKILEEENVVFKKDLHLLPFDTKSDPVIKSYESRSAEKRRFDINFHIYPDFVLTWIHGFS